MSTNGFNYMISLFEHNQIAYQAAVEMLEETGKAAVIHPTGTGKSFIGFKFCEQHPDKRIYWLSPSSYIFKTQLEALEEVANGYIPKNIVFHTYAKLSMLSAEEINDICPDYIILDEFHRCGAPVWGEAVNSLLKTYSEIPILGFSATNVRYLDSQRDMALELFDGNIASEMTLGEAVVKGILKPPKYVLSVFSYQKDLEKYQLRVKNAKHAEVRDKAEQYLEALRRALENAEGLDEIFFKHMPDSAGKYIVFCANVEHMHQMIEKAPQWFSKVDKSPYIYSVYSDDPAAENSFKEFKENGDPHHLKLLYCIDALNEGVHVKGVNGVILLRPTVSPIIYKQQIGRAMSANASHDVVIFDIVMNIDNLYSISSIKQEMEMAINELHAYGEGQRIVNEEFRVIDEVRDCRLLFEQLNDTLSASWEMMYSHAKAYFEEHGDLEVPNKYKTKDGYSLGRWIFTQRDNYRGTALGTLSESQKKRLDDIGMRWDLFDNVRWDKYCAAAKKYAEQNGHLACARTYITEDGLDLGRWLSTLRVSVKKGRRILSEEQKEFLHSIGMIWSLKDYQWETYFAEAKKYFEKHNNLNVPYKYVTPEGIRLYYWLDRARLLYREKTGSLSAEQISRLESIGMSWTTGHEDLWFSRFEEAKAYFSLHKNLDMPDHYRTENGISLGSWVRTQRRRRASNSLDADKIALLDSIGMNWQFPNSWEFKYGLARRYYEEHGNISTSRKFLIDGVRIGDWLSRLCKNKDKLNSEQIRLLEEIGL